MGRTTILTTIQLDTLKVARYELHVRARSDAALPPFLGSTLRGAFGHALKESVCVMSHRDCSRCFLVERCLYPRLFEPEARNGQGLLAKRQAAPRPFIFIPPLPSPDSGFMRARDDLLRWRVRVKAGEVVPFGLYLLGDAIEELPYIIHAISSMAHHGFGAERASFQLESVSALDYEGKRETVYTNGATAIRKHAGCVATVGLLTKARMIQLGVEDMSEKMLAAAASLGTAGAANTNLVSGEPICLTKSQYDETLKESATRPPQSAPSIRNPKSAIRNSLSLRFLTPTRLRIKGEVIENPSFAQLVSSISLRLSMLAETWGGSPLTYDYKSIIERAREVSTESSTLRLMALDRFSNRRYAKLSIDGFLGDVTFRGVAIPQLLPLIVAGEFLHVGSGTAFGLGRYLIIE